MGVMWLVGNCIGLGIKYSGISCLSLSWTPGGIQCIFYRGMEVELCVTLPDGP